MTRHWMPPTAVEEKVAPLAALPAGITQNLERQLKLLPLPPPYSQAIQLSTRQAFSLRVGVQAVITVMLAYALLTAIQSFTMAISEKVPRRFRLMIKQSVPFLEALVLVVAIAHLLHLFVNLTGSNLLALTGTIAMALGFALKDYISSILAGIVTLFETPFAWAIAFALATTMAKS